jgi:hypothetical protein
MFNPAIAGLMDRSAGFHPNEIKKDFIGQAG